MIFETTSAAPPDAVWRLLAEPACWSAWAPHIRGGVGLGTPEVQTGRSGVALVGPWLPVPVTVTAKEDGHFWDWRTGPVRVRHAVEAAPQGSIVRLELHAPAPLERALGLTYGPVIAWVARRLARVAAQPE
ncbi:MAG TPA: SRPBCC family protein [Solirubrobacteraceae bacterium]|nr:SRPBCC family protein [Solirubrobacteraceae bacterium]